MAAVVSLKVPRLTPAVHERFRELIAGIANEDGFDVKKVLLHPEYVHVELLGASGEDVATLKPIAERLTTRMERAIVPNASAHGGSHTVINNFGVAGAIGANAVASHNSFQQIVGDPTMTAQLLEQIERLQATVRKSDAPEEDLEAVVQAKVEAKSGRFDKALEFLGARAKTLLTFAETAGLKMLAEYIRHRAGLPPMS